MTISFEINGPPLREADLAQFETAAQLSVPPAYRTFLLSQNGGIVKPAETSVDGVDEPLDVVGFFGIGIEEPAENILYNLEVVREGYPHKDLFPIAFDHGGGLYCIEREAGGSFPIVYLEWGGAWQEEYRPKFVAHSFAEFLSLIDPEGR